MHMRSGQLVAGVLLLAACTGEADPVARSGLPAGPASPAPSGVPSLALVDVTLTCESRNERTADGTVQGRVVGLSSEKPHEVNVVQGTDAGLGRVALAPADAAGAVAFEVPVEKVLTEQPVRVVLRQSGVRGFSALVEVTPDAATCSTADSCQPFTLATSGQPTSPPVCPADG